MNFMEQQAYPAAKPKDMTRVNQFITHNFNVNLQSDLYKLPDTNFGFVAGYDMEYAGYWFSVDRHGTIRRHSFSSSGFGKS